MHQSTSAMDMMSFAMYRLTDNLNHYSIVVKKNSQQKKLSNMTLISINKRRTTSSSGLPTK